MSEFGQAARDLAFLEDHGMLAGVAEVIAERRRQVEKGYDAGHDDQHEAGELAIDAHRRLGDMLYAIQVGTAGYPECEQELRVAAALAAAEIDRLAAPDEITAVAGSPASPEQMLREFHASKAVHGGLMPAAPTADIPGWVRDLRMSLLDEEVGELREAVAAGDVVKIADALADIEFITRGTAVVYGIPSDAVFAEVHRSNMTKTNTPEEAKLVKGPRYEAPRIAEIFTAASGTGHRSPEVRTCYCGTTATVVPGVFPHRDCDGSVAAGTGPSAQDGDGAVDRHPEGGVMETGF